MPTRNLLRIASVAAALAFGGCVGAPTTGTPYVAAGGPTYGQQCVAGFYQCALPVAGAVGSSCSCPGIGTPSYGVIR